MSTFSERSISVHAASFFNHPVNGAWTSGKTWLSRFLLCAMTTRNIFTSIYVIVIEMLMLSVYRLVEWWENNVRQATFTQPAAIIHLVSIGKGKQTCKSRTRYYDRYVCCLKYLTCVLQRWRNCIFICLQIGIITLNKHNKST